MKADDALKYLMRELLLVDTGLLDEELGIKGKTPYRFHGLNQTLRELTKADGWKITAKGYFKNYVSDPIPEYVSKYFENRDILEKIREIRRDVIAIYNGGLTKKERIEKRPPRKFWFLRDIEKEHKMTSEVAYEYENKMKTEIQKFTKLLEENSKIKLNGINIKMEARLRWTLDYFPSEQLYIVLSGRPTEKLKHPLIDAVEQNLQEIIIESNGLQIELTPPNTEYTEKTYQISIQNRVGIPKNTLKQVKRILFS